MAELCEKSFPFDSNMESGEYDRVYVADDFARYFRAFISSGLFMKQSTNLQVISNGDMTVTLKAGSIIIDGYRYENESDITIPITPADGILDRIDRICITWSKADRDIHYIVQEGTASYSPQPVNIRRNSDFKDYVVAEVYVAAGVVSISQANITDTRLNSGLCGLAIPFTEIDTTSLYNQIQTDLTNFKNVSETEFEEWVRIQSESFNSWTETEKNNYIDWITSNENELTNWINTQETSFLEWVDSIKNILDETAAGNLQNEIEQLDQKYEQEILNIKGIVLSGRLKAWETELIFEDERIKENQNIKFFIDKYGIAAKNVVTEPGKITMTFRQYDFDIEVKAVIKDVFL